MSENVKTPQWRFVVSCFGHRCTENKALCYLFKYLEYGKK